MAPNIAHRKAGATETSDKTLDKPNSKRVTEKELKEHNGNSGSPYWIAIKDKVYDVTGFGKEHPGGEIIFTHVGQDATDVFNAFHPATVYKWFYVGELVKEFSEPFAYQVEHHICQPCLGTVFLWLPRFSSDFAQSTTFPTQ